MNKSREEWLEKATYSYRLCNFFSDTAWKKCDRIASAESLRTFLKRPSLSVKIMALNIYKDDVKKKDSFFETYSNIHNEESIHYIHTFKFIEKKLISYYEQGMTPDEAAIAVEKDCDTREEADEYSQLILKHGHPYRVISKFIAKVGLLIMSIGFLVWVILDSTSDSCRPFWYW